MMFIDIISGIVKTKRNRQKFSSAKMATGLYKKISTLLCMIVTDILAVNSDIIGFQLDIVKPVYIYIVFMEALSVFENCGEIGLIDLLKKFKENIKNENK